MRAFLPLVVMLALAGCAGNSVKDDDALPPEVTATPPVASDGAIYAANSGLSLFEDQKAHRVGDLLTVLLVEKTDAQKKADTSSAKKDSVGASAPTLFGNVISKGTIDLSADRAFSGSGASSQSNELSGSVTVVVTRVLPNGNLWIRGEKKLRLNQGSEKVSLEGLVRAVDISTSNTVTSDRVANARISYAGTGAVADANSQGWLSRFFSSVLFPF